MTLYACHVKPAFGATTASARGRVRHRMASIRPEALYGDVVFIDGLSFGDRIQGCGSTVYHKASCLVDHDLGQGPLHKAGRSGCWRRY